MPDALPPNPADQLAPNTQRRVRVLDDVINSSANLVRMIEHQTQQRFEAAQPGANLAQSPWPLITEDPVGAVEKLAKCIRHTVALAESLEHPRKTGPSNPSPAPRKPIQRDPLDVSRMTDGELAERLTEARERERAENYNVREKERAENLDRPFEEMVAIICRTLGLPQLPVGHPWRQQYLAELMPLMEYIEQHRATASTVPATAPAVAPVVAQDQPASDETHTHDLTLSDHPPNNPSTAPPDS